MRQTRFLKAGAIAGACVAVGAGAGILGSAGAATTNSGTPAPRAHRGGELRGLRRAVHVQAVLPVAGGKFATVTLDRGIVQSVQGNTITLNEGTRKATYKSVSITLPAGTVVHDNRQLAQLSQVKPGQMAVVFQGPQRTRVNAHDVRG